MDELLGVTYVITGYAGRSHRRHLAKKMFTNLGEGRYRPAPPQVRLSSLGVFVGLKNL
jgi:hypothetical protein